mgnify:CR=1 FL=1
MLESTLEAIQDFGKKKPSSKMSKNRQKEVFEEAKSRIENWGSADFEMRRAIIYRENYFTMLENKYSTMENYKEVVDRLKQIRNPIEFYKFVSNIESGEKLKDITFMYNTSDFQKIFNKLAEEIGIEDIEESEFEEGE